MYQIIQKASGRNNAVNPPIGSYLLGIYIDDIASGGRFIGDSDNIAFVSLGEIPGGLPAWGGSIVRVESSSTDGMAIGHLEDA